MKTLPEETHALWIPKLKPGFTGNDMPAATGSKEEYGVVKKDSIVTGVASNMPPDDIEDLPDLGPNHSEVISIDGQDAEKKNDKALRDSPIHTQKPDGDGRDRVPHVVVDHFRHDWQAIGAELQMTGESDDVPLPQ